MTTGDARAGEEEAMAAGLDLGTTSRPELKVQLDAPVQGAYGPSTGKKEKEVQRQRGEDSYPGSTWKQAEQSQGWPFPPLWSYTQ